MSSLRCPALTFRPSGGYVGQSGRNGVPTRKIGAWRHRRQHKSERETAIFRRESVRRKAWLADHAIQPLKQGKAWSQRYADLCARVGAQTERRGTKES
jgi:hypothetical protein